MSYSGNHSCSAGSIKYNDTEACWGPVSRKDAYRVFLVSSMHHCIIPLICISLSVSVSNTHTEQSGVAMVSVRQIEAERQTTLYNLPRHSSPLVVKMCVPLSRAQKCSRKNCYHFLLRFKSLSQHS